jgi:hypothetical protein
MIAEATKDASARAKSIAENGCQFRKFKKSDMGVFSTGQNSSEDFSYGGSFISIQKIKRLISRPILSGELIFNSKRQVDRSRDLTQNLDCVDLTKSAYNFTDNIEIYLNFQYYTKILLHTERVRDRAASFIFFL